MAMYTFNITAWFQAYMRENPPANTPNVVLWDKVATVAFIEKLTAGDNEVKACHYSYATTYRKSHGSGKWGKNAATDVDKLKAEIAALKAKLSA